MSNISGGAGPCQDVIVSARPLLRWAGSKRQLLPLLVEYWSEAFERYIEPFCGSSALYFRLRPDSAILSDSNRELIHFYEVVRRDPVRIWTETLAVARTKEEYLRQRALVPETMSERRRAVRFLFLNRHCFNGLYRTDRFGHFNVPFSGTKTGDLPSLDDFLSVASLLKRARLRCCDFGHTLKLAGRGDFVYLDPPFFVSSRRIFRDYGPRRFAAADITRLARHLDSLDSRGARFVMSFAECSEIQDLRRNWISRRVRVRRQIAGFAADRRQASEYLITNIASG